jgi:hypothetical protein
MTSPSPPFSVFSLRASCYDAVRHIINESYDKPELSDLSAAITEIRRTCMRIDRARRK